MQELILRAFTEEEYHRFFRHYCPDPAMDPTPFKYSHEQISRAYHYHFDGFRRDYAEYGIFLDHIPVGSFQLKRIQADKKTCEFGIILQNDAYKNKGIGTRAIQIGLELAHKQFGIINIIGETTEHNHRMIHILKKTGFSLKECKKDPLADNKTILVYRLRMTEETT